MSKEKEIQASTDNLKSQPEIVTLMPRDHHERQEEYLSVVEPGQSMAKDYE